jgi:hypothetical protein
MPTITVTLTTTQAAMLVKASRRCARMLRDEPTFMFPAGYESAEDYRRFLRAEARRLDAAAAVVEAGLEG